MEYKLMGIWLLIIAVSIMNLDTEYSLILGIVFLVISTVLMIVKEK